jgi:hypothetical protein
VHTVGVERPQQRLRDGDDRSAEAQVHSRLSSEIGNGAQFSPRLLLLFGEVPQEKTGEQQVRDTEDRLVQFEVDRREPRLPPRSCRGHDRLNEEHANGDAGRHDGSNEPPPVRGGQYDE